jgi:sigma-B regulation protein RsbU (phosphoserine phosphatase)
VGIVDDFAWDRRTTQLATGDVLIFYTDGVTEAQDGQGASFGSQRLLATVQSHLGRSAQEIQAAVLSAVHQFAGGVPQFDDITLIVLVREPA